MEFESDSIRIKDLRRFRVYEAHISFSYDVTVTTYVICSSDVKIIRSELQEGINTYRVQIIRMKDKDADVLIADLEEKQRSQPRRNPIYAGRTLCVCIKILNSHRVN